MPTIDTVTDTAAPTLPKRERTRERLMDAAVIAFSEHGFGGASIEVICERAGMTRGAFYYNFSSKEEIFAAMMERELEIALGLFSTGVNAPAGGDLTQAIGMLSNLFQDGQRDYVTLSLLSEEFRLHAMRDDDAAAAYTEQFRKIHDRLGSAIGDIAAAHGLRLLTAPETIAAIATGIFFQTVNEGVLARLKEAEIQQRAIDRVTIALTGLLPPA